MAVIIRGDYSEVHLAAVQPASSRVKAKLPQIFLAAIPVVCAAICSYPALAGKYDDDYTVSEKVKLIRKLIYDGHSLDARRLISPLCHKAGTTSDMYCLLASTYLDDPEQDPKANKEVVDCLNQAIKIDPDNGEAYKLMAEHLNAQGQFQEVIKYCQKAIHAKKYDMSALRQSAVARSNLGQNQEALKDFSAFMAQGHKENYFNLNTKANLLGKLKRYDEAVATLRESLKLRNQDLTVYQIINYLELAGKDKEAIAELNYWIKKNPLDGEATAMRARIQLKSKNFAAAEKDYSKAIELEPSIKLYKERAGVYAALGNKPAAAKDLAKVSEIQKEPF